MGFELRDPLQVAIALCLQPIERSRLHRVKVAPDLPATDRLCNLIGFPRCNAGAIGKFGRT